ncbi:MAG: hypothetical protein ACYTXY_38020, partial [Nostoc sp.]
MASRFVLETYSANPKYFPTRPISVWDSEYGCAPFLLKTANIPVDILVRLRSNLCLWGEPLAYSGKGRPKKHGDRFKRKCSDNME